MLRRYKPYREKLSNRKKLFSLLRYILLLFVFFEIITSLFFASYRVNSVSMMPEFEPGDRIIISTLAFNPRVPFLKYKLKGITTPERGDIVLVTPQYIEKNPVSIRILDSLTGFFSLGRIRVTGGERKEWESPYTLKRIIGLPGDAVRMEKFIAYIKPEGSDTFLPEFELSPVRYTIETLSLPLGWDSDLPFSGYLSEIELGQNEFLLLGDNRGSSSDSLYWGVPQGRNILGKVLFRYAPIQKFGVPE